MRLKIEKPEGGITLDELQLALFALGKGREITAGVNRFNRIMVLEIHNGGNTDIEKLARIDIVASEIKEALST